MEESVIIKWLKRIFSLQTLSILGTLGGIYFGITQFRHDTGGDLNASYNTELLRNNEYRDLIVYTDSKEFSINNLCPNFNNTDKYTLKDFNLQHTIETQDIHVFNSDFYTSFKLSDNSSAIKYYDNSLSPHQSTENPISKIIMDSQQGSCLITSRATWDGADIPFIFKANVNFTQIPIATNESFENWKRKCKEYTAENFKLHIYDAIYLSSKGEDRDYNVSISTETSSIASCTKEVATKETKTSMQTPPANSERADDTKPKIESVAKSIVQEIYIADSTITQYGNTYRIRYILDKKSSSFITDAFIVYYYSFRDLKRISGSVWHLNKYNNEFEWTFNDMKLINILGVANENPSLQEYISIKGYNFRNNHSSKFIGIDASVVEDGKVISKCTTVIEPNSSTTFGCKEGSILQNIKYYEIGEQIVNGVPEYQSDSKDKKGISNFWAVMLMIVLPFIFWIPFLLFLIDFIGSCKAGYTFKKSYQRAFENTYEGIKSPWCNIIFYISTVGALSTLIMYIYLIFA